MFINLKKAVETQFNKMQKSPLFIVEYNREVIYQEYLNGFSPELMQEHNCNCCKSFIRQMGGVVGIVNNKLVSIWDDLGNHPDYNQSIKNLQRYVKTCPIQSTFTFPTNFCGTEKSNDLKRNVVWRHFRVDIDRKYVTSSGNQSLTTKTVLQNSLNGISVDSLESVLELIAQNSLYRGKEFEENVKKFLELKKKFDKVPVGQRDIFCWYASTSVSSALSHIKNSAIGTLLQDLNDGIELDEAVTKFERVVAPTNYKRPTSLVTPKMVQQAKEKLIELDLLDAIERRHANLSDINVENLLFTDKSTQMADIFDDLSNAVVNPKTLTKVEEISMEDFVSKLIPTAKSIEVLVENRHCGNLVSILTSDSPKKLFKWDNPFSWSYSGGVTDSIKELVKSAGGKVDGVLRASLSWYNTDDLDLHCHTPMGNEIYFGNKAPLGDGCLDVDMNVSALVRNPVENIIWATADRVKYGKYTVSVHNFRRRENVDSGYTLQIEANGEIFDLEFPTSPRSQGYATPIVFNFTKNGIEGLSAKSATVSKDKWGIKTNTFVKVKQVLLSPNHWGNPVGNKHYFFVLDKCVSDETPRGFYNEFLADELSPHRKVFEILGGKSKVNETTNQLSGLGFSETLRNNVFIRVEGSFKRILKVIL